jgi:transglutaminase-like putative cysteine protease
MGRKKGDNVMRKKWIALMLCLPLIGLSPLNTAEASRTINTSVTQSFAADASGIVLSNHLAGAAARSAGASSSDSAPLQPSNKAITLGQLAELYFGEEEEDSRITIVDPSFKEDTPYYVKAAFMFGLVDSADELNKTMTREEAAIRIARSKLYRYGSAIEAKDFMKIDPTKLSAVEDVASGAIPLINGNFEPKQPFTVAQAIEGKESYSPGSFRGIIPAYRGTSSAAITVGGNYTWFEFNSAQDAKTYIGYHIAPYMNGVKLTGKYQRFDVGYAILELWTPNNGIKFTYKNNIENFYINTTSRTITYGYNVYSGQSIEGYRAEPRELKAGEKVVMEVQPDAASKKLYSKLDNVLKTIIKPGMNETAKVKAIHDYVVSHMTYSGRADYISSDNALIALEKGKGVCVHYASLFHYLARQAGLNSRVLQGPALVGQHAWNAVYVNGKWLFVDTTLDDTKKTTEYTYYLKDASFMMKTHMWRGFGYPDYSNHAVVDGMKIQTTDELRAYLLQQLWKRWGDPPATIKFKVLNKNVDTDTRFLRLQHVDAIYKMKYDAKTGIYTLTKT